MKRGVSAPFVWIFAMVAGAIVMIFIISFAFQHSDIQTKKFSAQDLGYFEINLDLISQSKSLTTQMQLPEIEFPCVEQTQFIKTGSAVKITNKIIFSKPQQGKTTIKSRLFSYPFPITQVFFLADTPYPNQFSNLDETLIPNQIYYQDLSQAECVKLRLIQKIQQISDIYIKKAGYLIRNNPECREYYKEIIKQINQHKINPNNQLAIKINNLNKELNLNDCPTIY